MPNILIQVVVILRQLLKLLQGASVHHFDVLAERTRAVRTEYGGKSWWVVALASDGLSVATRAQEASPKQSLLGVTVSVRG